MLTPSTLKKLQVEQNKLDQLIYQQYIDSIIEKEHNIKAGGGGTPIAMPKIKFEWISLWNARRLKLALFTEVAEFANELKTFKIWRKKKETDWTKAKEELIDCLCFFLGLCNIYQINFASYQFQFPLKEKEFNDLLLKFFSQTKKLSILNPKKKILTSTRLTKIQVNTYYNWLQVFNEIVQKLKMSETEVLAVYLRKISFNKERAKRGH